MGRLSQSPNSKIFQKGIDKAQNLCYNISTERGKEKMKTISIQNTPPVYVGKVSDIQKIMKNLGCSYVEAVQVLMADAEVDKMPMSEVNADLTAEQKSAVKSATIAHTKKRTAVKKERKVDNIKKRFLNGIKTYLEGCGATITKVKTETELTFVFKGESYTIKLIKHRPPKT